MKQKFRLSKSNIIYFLVIAILFLALFTPSSEMTPSQLSKLAGKLSSFFLIPLLVSWIAWRLMQKKNTYTSMAFSGVLTTLVLGSFGSLLGVAQEVKQLKELRANADEAIELMSNTDDPATIDSIYNELMESTKDGLDELSASSSGSERRFYALMSEFTNESQTITMDWSNAITAVQSPRILDHSLLNNEEEFDQQRRIMSSYVEKTKVYRTHYSGMIPALEYKLRVLGEDNEYAKGVIKGCRAEYLASKPILEPLLEAHIEYGDIMIQILDLLRKYRDEWSFENDELLTFNEIMLNRYLELSNALGESELELEKLIE